jgi:hypothetical protein
MHSESWSSYTVAMYLTYGAGPPFKMYRPTHIYAHTRLQVQAAFRKLMTWILEQDNIRRFVSGTCMQKLHVGRTQGIRKMGNQICVIGAWKSCYAGWINVRRLLVAVQLTNRKPASNIISLRSFVVLDTRALGKLYLEKGWNTRNPPRLQPGRR